MGRSIKDYGNGKYNIFSTITDTFLFKKPKSKAQILNFLDAENMAEFKLKSIKMLMEFPGRWSNFDKDRQIFNIPEGAENYFRWYDTIISSENYFEEIDKKHKELLDNLNSRKV